jgi:hypothetical protein
MSLQICAAVSVIRNKNPNDPNKSVPTKRQKYDTRPSKFNHLTRSHPSRMSNMR